MRVLTRAVVGVLCVVFAGGAAGAAGLPQPKVEYSAVMTMRSDEGNMKAKVNYAPGRERREMTVAGESSIQILRFDKNVLWILMPGERMYMSAPMPDDVAMLTHSDTGQMQMTPLGEETVNGVRATKNAVKGSEPDGERYEGFVWVTKDDIVVKFEMTSTGTGENGRFAMELSNLKVGKQDPALFEIPAGYTKFDMGGMMRNMPRR